MELLDDEAATASVAEDFGHVVRARPSAVVRARTIADVAAAIRHARDRGMRVVARGQGHTTGGQSMREGGIAIDLGGLADIGPVVDHRIRCGAGARWIDVVRAAVAAGATPPVLTDYLGLSVGGTLSVGGIGGQTFRHGLQVDNVVRLRVVTGDGEIRDISSIEEPQLFDCVRAGLGRLAVIVEAELALVPAPAKVCVRHLPYRDLDTFLRDQRRLIEDGRFDYVLGNIPARGDDGWGFSIETIEHQRDGGYHARVDDLACERGPFETFELDYFAYANRLAPMEQMMRERGTWHDAHPWLDVFLPASRAPAFIAEALAELRPRDVGDGYVMTYPARRATSGAPLVGLGDEPHAFLFDVLSTVRRTDAPRTLAAIERLGQRALDVGGALYPIGSVTMPPARWQQQLGPRAELVRVLARVFDPDGVFAGGALQV